MSSSKRTASPIEEERESKHPKTTGPRSSASQVPSNKLPSLQPFAEAMTRAIEFALPSGRDYSNKVLVSLKWSSTDVNVEPTRSELIALLKKYYGFAAEHIDLQNPAGATKSSAQIEFIHSFSTIVRKHLSTSKASKTLFVIYYSGHGSVVDDQLWVHGNADETKVGIYWDSALQALLQPDDSNDHLIVMDCCYAGLANLRENVETLAATSWNSPASGNPQQNFTADLIKALKNNALPITAAELHHKMLMLARNYQHAMPIHRLGRGSKPSVVLNPQIGTKTTFDVAPDAGMEARAQVVLKITLRKAASVPDIEGFERYFSTRLPPEVGKVEVIAQWESLSQTLLIAIPSVVWCCLPDRDEFTFVDFRF